MSFLNTEFTKLNFVFLGAELKLTSKPTKSDHSEK